MEIAFQRLGGDPSLGIVFFWMLRVETKTPSIIRDHFIPELFLDYFLTRNGEITFIDEIRGTRESLPRQVLKTLHVNPLILLLKTPLVVFGVRLSLEFAESFWEENLEANRLREQDWVPEGTADLTSFATRVTRYIRKRGRRIFPSPLLSPELEESSWLAGFSARHKRRLYRRIFGLSRKELQNIHKVHTFLGQTCDFLSGSPRIIEHVTPEVFYDQPHLNHTFRKMTGFSPLEYFQASSILQDNLMSASYNEFSA